MERGGVRIDDKIVFSKAVIASEAKQSHGIMDMFASKTRLLRFARNDNLYGGEIV
jgi:hypothetical protein